MSKFAAFEATGIFGVFSHDLTPSNLGPSAARTERKSQRCAPRIPCANIRRTCEREAARLRGPPTAHRAGGSAPTLTRRGAPREDRCQPIHAMKPHSISKAQAIAESEAFVRDNLASAREDLADGHTQRGYEHLGYAMHTLQDATSPSHEAFQEFGSDEPGIVGWVKHQALAIAHVAQELLYPGDPVVHGELAPGNRAVKGELEAASRWAHDIATGEASMPEKFFNPRTGRLAIPEEYLTPKSEAPGGVKSPIQNASGTGTGTAAPGPEVAPDTAPATSK
jgi:hypothetical protein